MNEANEIHFQKKTLKLSSKKLKEKFIQKEKLAIKQVPLKSKKKKLIDYKKIGKNSNNIFLSNIRRKYAVISNKVRESFIERISNKKVTIKQV